MKEMNSRRGKSIAKAVVYCAIAAAVFVWFLGHVGRVWSAMMGSGTAEARVVEVNEDEREDGQGHVRTVTVAIYEFRVLGQRYRGKTEASLDEGDTVAVVCDTDDPRNNRAKGGRDAVFNLFFLGLLALPVSYYVLAHNVPIVLREWQREHPEASD